MFKKILSARGMGQVLSVFAALIVMIIVFALINPLFFSATNITNLLRQVAPILIIGVGQSFVLITAGIDLSIGSVAGMSCMISATLMTKFNMNPILTVLITIICCLAIGLVNGTSYLCCKASGVHSHPRYYDNRPRCRADCQRQHEHQRHIFRRLQEFLLLRPLPRDIYPDLDSDSALRFLRVHSFKDGTRQACLCPRLEL